MALVHYPLSCIFPCDNWTIHVSLANSPRRIKSIYNKKQQRRKAQLMWFRLITPKAGQLMWFQLASPISKYQRTKSTANGFQLPPRASIKRRKSTADVFQLWSSKAGIKYGDRQYNVASNCAHQRYYFYNKNDGFGPFLTDKFLLKKAPWLYSSSGISSP